MNTIPVTKIYYTIESEGKRVGFPHIFFETNKCHVKDYCYLCKTPDRRSSGKYFLNTKTPVNFNVDDFERTCLTFNCPNIAFDCGEFLIMDGFEGIVKELSKRKYWITVITSGRFEIPAYLLEDEEILIHLVMNSGTKDEYVRQLKEKDQIKVVINAKKDVELLKHTLQIGSAAQIYAVPVPQYKYYGPQEETISEVDVMELVLNNNWNCRVLVPQHMYIGDFL